MEGDAPQASWFSGLSRFGYGRSFDKALARAAGGRPGFGREMLALGPQAHFSSTAAGIVVLVVIVCIVLASLSMAGVFQYKEEVGAGIGNSMFGFMGTLIGGVTQLRASLIKRRYEQTLVSLLPGVPRGQAFNRLLAKSLLLNFLGLWAFGSVAMAVLVGTIPGTGYALLAFIVTLLAGGLVLLRDWAKPNNLKGWWAVFVYLPVSIVAIASRFAMEKGIFGVGTFLAVAVVVLGLLYAWRWRVMTGARMAWPATRE